MIVVSRKIYWLYRKVVKFRGKSHLLELYYPSTSKDGPRIVSTRLVSVVLILPLLVQGANS